MVAEKVESVGLHEVDKIPPQRACIIDIERVVNESVNIVTQMKTPRYAGTGQRKLCFALLEAVRRKNSCAQSLCARVYWPQLTFLCPLRAQLGTNTGLRKRLRLA